MLNCYRVDPGDEAVAGWLSSCARSDWKLRGGVALADRRPIHAGEFRDACRALGITLSIGTVGDSCDNAMAESFFSGFKREVIDGEHSRSHPVSAMRESQNIPPASSPKYQSWKLSSRQERMPRLRSRFGNPGSTLRQRASMPGCKRVSSDWG